MLKRKVSCTFKRKITLEIQERIYQLVRRRVAASLPRHKSKVANARVAA